MNHHRPRHPRRGAALVVAIVMLVLVAGLLTAMTRLGLATRQRIALDERLAQAEWLAASGLERGVARLRGDPDFDGEDWEISEGILGGRLSALVSIAVESPAGGTDRVVTARAELRLPPDRTIRRTRTATVSIPAAAAASEPSPDVTDTTTTRTDEPGLDAAPEDER